VDEQAAVETIARYAGVGDIGFAACDVSDENRVMRCVAAAPDKYGRLNALVNNAGISASPRTPPQRMDLTRWNRVLAVNLTGTFLMAKCCAPHIEWTAGANVNVASTRALQSEPDEAYSAFKGGVIALTHALAFSLGPNIRVNCILPGWIDTGEWQKQDQWRDAVQDKAEHAQHPAGRIGNPLDIGELAAFLLSPAAANITGQNIISGGGMMRKIIYRE
jgi:NAD(P)-dependent dehydrogenase (short-subunit alcohol dehydrogenase family)